MAIIYVRIVGAVLIAGWQASALYNGVTTSDGEGAKVPSDFPASLAGCRTGNFAAEGSNGCTGVQRLQCDKAGECTGILEGKPYQINCNHQHECITHKWGDALVRKFFSLTRHDGSLQWNNGCSWTCEDVPSTFVRKASGTSRTLGWFLDASNLPPQRKRQLDQIIAQTNCEGLREQSKEKQSEVTGGFNKKTLLLGVGIVGSLVGVTDAYGADVASQGLTGQAAHLAYEHFEKIAKIPALVVDGVGTLGDFAEEHDSVLEADLAVKDGVSTWESKQISAARKIGLGAANFVIFSVAIGAELFCGGACLGGFVSTAHAIMAPINIAALGLNIREGIDENAEIAYFTSGVGKKCSAAIKTIVKGEGEMEELHIGPLRDGEAKTEHAYTSEEANMVDCVWINPATGAAWDDGEDDGKCRPRTVLEENTEQWLPSGE